MYSLKVQYRDSAYSVVRALLTPSLQGFDKRKVTKQRVSIPTVVTKFNYDIAAVGPKCIVIQFQYARKTVGHGFRTSLFGRWRLDKIIRWAFFTSPKF